MIEHRMDLNAEEVRAYYSGIRAGVRVMCDIAVGAAREKTDIRDIVHLWLADFREWEKRNISSVERKRVKEEDIARQDEMRMNRNAEI